MTGSDRETGALNHATFILFLDGGRVVAAAGPRDEWPSTLCIRGVRYQALRGEDTFFFWDELRDSAGATVGFNLMLPESQTFRQSRFLRASQNVAVDREEVNILLQPCAQPNWKCVLGFGSEIYVREDDPTECALVMFDWSKNPVAFPLCTAL